MSGWPGAKAMRDDLRQPHQIAAWSSVTLGGIAG
jgi:hypothetical protein